MANRWVELTETTPSGRMMFVCSSCGRKTDAPSDECPKPATFVADKAVHVPCSAWPMKPDDWLRIQREIITDHIVFSGTITFEDGQTIHVTAPIHEALAKDITVISTEIKMRENSVIDKLEEVQEREDSQDLSELQNRMNKMQELFRKQADAVLQSTADRLRNKTMKSALDGMQDDIDKLSEKMGATRGQTQAALGGGLSAGARGPDGLTPSERSEQEARRSAIAKILEGENG